MAVPSIRRSLFTMDEPDNKSGEPAGPGGSTAVSRMLSFD